MLKIKLSRQGKKKHAFYRLIISEQARDPYGKILELLGSYDPHTKELKADSERIKYWIGHGAQMTPTVNNLLVSKNIVAGKKVAVSKLSKKTREELAKKTADVAVAANKAAEPVPEVAEVKIEETPVQTVEVENPAAATPEESQQ